MSVRAKFKVVQVVRRQHWEKGKGEVQTITLSPVMDGSAENRKFYAATPSGSIELAAMNADVAHVFELGAEFYVDFKPASRRRRSRRPDGAVS